MTTKGGFRLLSLKLAFLLLIAKCFCRGDCGPADAELSRDESLPSSSRRLIVGGTEVSPSAFPYVTRLASAGRHKCAATIITSQVLLTAAHCVSQTGEVQIRRQGSSYDDYESFVIENYAVHPHYYNHAGSTQGTDVDPHDIAILKIYGRSKQKRFVVLNRDPERPRSNDELLVLGWGTTNASDPSSFSDSLREAKVAYLSNEDCIKAKGNASNGVWVDFQNQIIDVSLCTLRPDACAGDSGGPLLLDGVQVGVVSASFGCNHPRLPGLNVRLSHVMDWINRIVCELSDDPSPGDFYCPRVEVPEFASSTSYVTLTVVLQLDSHPEERGWVLQSLDSRGSTVTEVERPIFFYKNEMPWSRVVETVVVPNDREYRFTVMDSFGDGSGILSVTSENGTAYIPDTVFSFEYSKTETFIIGTPPSPMVPFSPLPTPTMTRLFLTVVIQLDSFPTETGFLLESFEADNATRVLAVVYPGFYGNQVANTLVSEKLYLDPLGTDETQRYRFTMTDNEHDGISPGMYQVWFGHPENGQLLITGGDFFLEDAHIFEIPAALPASQTTPVPVKLPISVKPTEVAGHWRPPVLSIRSFGIKFKQAWLVLLLHSCCVAAVV